MRIAFTLGLCCFCMLQSIMAQISLDSISNLDYGATLNDIWGWVDSDDQKEYALVGMVTGVDVVDISTPHNPISKFFILGPNSTWRDIKTWGNYMYVSNETGSGIQVVNLSYMPDSIQTQFITPNGLSSIHNLFIDENGILYVIGSNIANGGVVFYDLNADPENPAYLGEYSNKYVHDCFVRGDTLYNAEIYEGRFTVIDIADKSLANDPQSFLGSHPTPNSFSHNVWLSDDSDYLFATDEVNGAYISAYDITDLNNIVEVDRIRSNPGTNSMPHNTFFKDGFLISSYYRDGMRVHDASNPSNLVEVGYYDSSPLSGGGSQGVWGVYPYLPSGNILISDLQEGLFVLGDNYQAACFLEGIVTDFNSGLSLNNVQVQISGSISSQTDIIGTYQMGLADSGNYQVSFSKAGYYTKTVSNVSLQNGQTTFLNAELLDSADCDAIFAESDSIETGFGSQCTYQVDLLANDSVLLDSALSVRLIDSNGILINGLTNGVLSFQILDSLYTGTLSLDYSICNFCGICDTASLQITVTAVSCEGVFLNANNDSISICSTDTGFIEIISNDTSNHSTVFNLQLLSTSSNISLSLQNNILEFSSIGSFSGIENISYQLCQSIAGNLYCDTAHVNIELEDCSIAPIIEVPNVGNVDEWTAWPPNDYTESYCFHIIHEGNYHLHLDTISLQNNGSGASIENDSCILYQFDFALGIDSFYLLACDLNNPNLCDSLLVLVLPENPLDDIKNTTQFISLYPNPFHDLVINAVGIDEDPIISLFSSSGKKINTSFKSDTIYIIDDITSGIYYLKVEAEDHNYTYKLVKQ